MTNRQTRSSHLEFRTVRRNIILSLIAGVIICTSLVLFSPENSTSFFGDTLRSASAGIATVLSLIVVYRQKVDGLFGKAYAALAIGISLWFIAEMIWTYYEIGLGIETPFPSPADAVWIIGYGPFIYYMFKTYKLFIKRSKSVHVIAISAIVIIILAFYIYQTFITSDLSTINGIVQFLISIAYPIGDVIFVVPATLIILNSGKGELTSIPWIFLAMLVTAIADSIFGYTSVAGIAADRIWSPIYIAGYLLFAGGLFWYNRFFIVSEKPHAKGDKVGTRG